VNKRHKILLNEKDSPHQCVLIIKSATKSDSGQFKFYSNYGGHQISECSLRVNESPQADHKHALFSLVVLAAVITVTAVIAAIVKLVYIVKAKRRQANHQPADLNLELELEPLGNQN